MPPEGPNKSEELLKRYAKERQEQSPNLPLHPATRRLLQGEVARQFGKKSALENRGWSAWFGVMRGRLAIGTALGAVAVTGVCVWWNNQRPQPMEMAKAERTAKELAPPSRTSADEIRLKTRNQIAAVDAPSPVPPQAEARWRAPAAPAARAIRPDAKASQAGDELAANVTAAQNGFGLSDLATATASTVSLGGSFGRGTAKSENFGSALGVVSTDGAMVTAATPLAKLDANGISPSNFTARLSYAESTAKFNDTTSRTELALAYNFPAAESGSVPASAPSVNLGDNERKNQSKLSDTAKLAEGPPLLEQTEGETLNRSRRASLEPQAPAAQPPTTTAQPSLTLGESLAADKRQQPSAPAQPAGDLAAQVSPARPESSESTARYFAQSALAASPEAAKQKAYRELDRLDTQPVVLNRFVIEQQGNSVRVVEADGSVYDGNVEEPVITVFDTDLSETFAEKKDKLAGEKPVALKSSIVPQTDGYSFRASGSNVTLRQMVVVNGRFAAGTNSAARSGSPGVAGGLSGLSRNTPAPASRSITTNRANAQRPAFGGRYGLATNQPATIEGTVRIGVTNQQWFRAVRDSR